MKTNRPRNRICTLLVAFGLLAFGAASAVADEVATGANSSSAFRNDANFQAWGIGKNWLGSTEKSDASTITRSHAFYASTLTAGQGVGILYKKNTVPGQTWLVEATIGDATANTSLVMNLASTNATLSTTTTTAFKKATANTWQFVCYLTNNPTEVWPELEITYGSGTFGDRFYSDVYRFTLVSPCLSVAAVQTGPPYIAGQTSVTVSNVSASATNITVYKKTGTGTPVQIGQKTSGITAGNNVVTVTALVKSDQVMATQTINGQEGCVPSTGAYVGGGSNPRIRVSLNMRTSASFVGPIGASGTVSTALGQTTGMYFMPGTGNGNPPAGGTVVTPSGCWQTIKIDPRTAAQSGIWVGSGTSPDTLPWAAIDSFALMQDDTTDVGPFAIYIDNLANGTTLLHNWEDATPGALGLFNSVANYAGTAGYLQASPQSAVVACTTNAATPNQANGGTNSQFVNWEWNSVGTAIWLRMIAGAPGVASWPSYPQIDRSKPIYFDILVVPVGGTPHSIGAIGYMADQTNCVGETITLTVPTNGISSYTYVWKKGTTTISGATTHAYTRTLVVGDSGTYSCTVSDGTCSLVRDMILTVPPAVVIETQPTGPGNAVQIGSAWTFSATAIVTNACPCANDPALTYQWRLNGNNIAGATDASYILNSIQMADAGWYTVVVSNTCNAGIATSAAAQLAVTDPNVTPVAASCGAQPNGLLGLYWTNQTSANAFTVNAPTWTNTDSQVNFSWGTSGFNIGSWPAGTNNFTVRWFGKVQAPYDGQTYTFYVKSDDGARLWVNGQLLINRWATGSSEPSGSIVLSSAAPVDILLQYFEQTSTATAILSWSSESLFKEVIPQAQLCAALDTDPVPPLITLTAPANNAIATLGNAVTLNANVTNFTSTINKVEFYGNATNLLATANSFPYTQSWLPSATNVYNITARVYYNGVSTLNTPSNKLTVNVPALGQVTITNISGTTLSYSGGAGSQFVLLKSATANAAMTNWTPVLTNGATPGSFTIPAVGTDNTLFYRVQSK